MQRADQRKYHYIYKIIRDDGRYYIGMHSTDDLEDGYFGSGKKITRSIKKHGKEKHSKIILEFLPSRNELRNREEQLVTEELIADPRCMNIARGGHPSGFFSEEHQMAAIAGTKAMLAARSFEERSIISKKSMITQKARGKIPFANSKRRLGSKQSEDTKRKISLALSVKQAGEKNSQYGTCWVTNGKPIKIKKEQLDEYLANGYSRGRKLKMLL